MKLNELMQKKLQSILHALIITYRPRDHIAGNQPLYNYAYTRKTVPVRRRF